jgi:hypothetical protein
VRTGKNGIFDYGFSFVSMLKSLCNQDFYQEGGLFITSENPTLFRIAMSKEELRA